ncbi:MAG TPA: transposase, partial [Acetobacteraceae bacterium]|nr:transposase [Acetobacteraceae bacterium]
MSNFCPTDRETWFLMPRSVDEWLAERHLARFIVEVVEGLDLRGMSGSYRGSGSASYHPTVPRSLLAYGYATGVFSSRKLERATYDSVAFRFIAGNEHPDHDTIATFRRRFLRRIQALFVEVLKLAREMGVLKLGMVALDRTKIHANASRHSALSYEHAGKIEAQLKAGVADLLAKAEVADHADVPDGLSRLACSPSQLASRSSIPEELARREARLARLAEARAKIEVRAKERFEREQAEYEAKLAAREAKTEARLRAWNAARSIGTSTWWRSAMNRSFFFSFAAFRMRSSACDTLAPSCARRVRCCAGWSALRGPTPWPRPLAPPISHPAARSCSQASQLRRTRSGRADVAGRRGRPRSQDRGPARDGPSGSVSGATISAEIHPEAG